MTGSSWTVVLQWRVQSTHVSGSSPATNCTLDVSSRCVFWARSPNADWLMTSEPSRFKCRWSAISCVMKDRCAPSSIKMLASKHKPCEYTGATAVFSFQQHARGGRFRSGVKHCSTGIIVTSTFVTFIRMTYGNGCSVSWGRRLCLCILAQIRVVFTCTMSASPWRWTISHWMSVT